MLTKISCLARLLPYRAVKTYLGKEKRPMKKLLTVMAVMLLVAAVAVPSFAQRGWRGYGDSPCKEITKVTGLNLTAEQKTRLTEMEKAHLKDVKPLQDKLFSRQGDLRLLWLEKNLDQARITTTEKEVRSLRDQIHDKRNSYQWAVYKMLTPDQRERLRNYGPAGCFGSGFGPGRGHGRGPADGFGPGRGPGGPCMMAPAADKPVNK